MTTQRITWSLLLAGALMTAACGDSKSSMNPVAPSAVVADAQSDEAGAEGVVSSAAGKNDRGKDKEKQKGNGNGNGKGNDQPTVPTMPLPPGNTTPVVPPTNTSPSGPSKVQIEGVIAAKSSNSITVNGQVVSVPSSAVIRHGDRRFTFADLHVGDRVHVKAMRVQPETSSMFASSTIEATEVKLQNRGDANDDDDEDDDPATPTMLVSVAAADATASETGGNSGTFRFTRSGDTSAELTITFTLIGTATNGLDYQDVPLTVMFAAGQATANVLIRPVSDGITEGSETVIVTVEDGAGYVAGSPATAMVTIAG